MYQPKTSDPLRTYDPMWIERADQRLTVIRDARQRLNDLALDLGGDLSYQEAALARRLIWIELVCEGTERKIAEGATSEDSDVNAYVQRINSLIGLCRALGLKRRARPVEDLGQYLSRRAAEAEDAPEAGDVAEDADSDPSDSDAAQDAPLNQAVDRSDSAEPTEGLS